MKDDIAAVIRKGEQEIESHQQSIADLEEMLAPLRRFVGRNGAPGDAPRRNYSRRVCDTTKRRPKRAEKRTNERTSKARANSTRRAEPP